jgi:hypothetical protein
MKRKKLKTRNLVIRVSPEEYAGLQEKFKGTTHRVFSDYIRDLLHQKPVTVWQRNKSLDEFLITALALKNELLSIGKNFNQAVKKLNSLSPSPELEEIINYFADEEFSVRQKIDEIKKFLIKMYELWSQK